MGCEPIEKSILLKSDTSITFNMHHQSELMNLVVIKRKKSITADISYDINKAQIQKQSSKNLAELLENIQGVRSLKSNGNVAKPILDGLHGNRISIINHGVTHSGQQWGNDHAPEIDPFSAQEISLEKGAKALLYSQNVVGGIIFLSGKPIPKDKHFHGKTNYIYETVSSGHTFNYELVNYNKILPFKITATTKRKGDIATPKYFLTNTGLKQEVITLTLEKKIKKRLSNRFYYSFFNNTQGVLKGSQIGNLSDLRKAFSREIPFFTEDYRTQSIDYPKQKTSHHLISLENKYTITDNTSLKFNNSFQYNNREEFDVRRGGRSSIPELWMQKKTFKSRLDLNSALSEKTLFQFGLEYENITNINKKTGVKPIIPNYLNNKFNAFNYLSIKLLDNLNLKLGSRYEYKNLFVAYFPNIPLTSIKFASHYFSTGSLASDISYAILKNLMLTGNYLISARNPAINELYSNGIHQGVSSIEEGNKDLKNELNNKVTLGVSFRPKRTISLEAVAFFHHSSNYIYLEPQENPRLTIRGAFPVFIYKQTNASIVGVNLAISYKPTKNLNLWVGYNYLEGNNLTTKKPLIYMPPNQLKGKINYQIASYKKFLNNTFSLKGEYVFKQSYLHKDQDFILPPNPYLLLNFEASTTISIKSIYFSPSLEISNLLNTSYRSYLNRLRYYANEPGINLLLKLNITF